jgi:hypothetical protein
VRNGNSAGEIMATRKTSKWAQFARPDGTFDFDALSDEQKEEFYRGCETVGSEEGAPLTATQRRLHAAARRRGRPQKGRGAQVVSLSIEKDLLRRAEQVARAHGISRSELFSRGLRAVVAVNGAA